MTTERTPGALGSNDQFGLVPIPAPSDPHRVGALTCAYTAADMEAYAKTAMMVMRERCAAWCEAAALEYDACATSALATEHGRELHRNAAEWARSMAAAIRRA